MKRRAHPLLPTPVHVRLLRRASKGRGLAKVQDGWLGSRRTVKYRRRYPSPGPYRSPGTQGTIGQALAHDLSATFASRQPLRARQTPPCLLDGLYPRATSPLNITATSTALGYPLETSSSGA